MSTNVNEYMQQIFKNGYLIALHIRRWGMSTKLREQDIKLNAALPKEVDLGKVALITSEAYKQFKAVENKARGLLYSNSFSFPGVPAAHFVPKNRWPSLEHQLAEIRKEFNELVEELLTNYSGYQAAALAHYEQYKDAIDSTWLSQAYPPVEQLREKFSFDWMPFEIALPTSFGKVDLQTELAREEARGQAHEEAREEFKRKMAPIDEFVADVVSKLRTGIAEYATVVLGRLNSGEAASVKSVNTLLARVQDFRNMNFIGDDAIEQELAGIEQLLTRGSRVDAKTHDHDVLTTLLNSVVEKASNVSDFSGVSNKFFRNLAL